MQTTKSYLVDQFILACSTCSWIDYAVLAFIQMENPNVFVYDAMTGGLVHCGYPIQALEFYVNILSVKV